jgi:hypothetical protein
VEAIIAAVASLINALKGSGVGSAVAKAARLGWSPMRKATGRRKHHSKTSLRVAALAVHGELLRNKDDLIDVKTRGYYRDEGDVVSSSEWASHRTLLSGHPQAATACIALDSTYSHYGRLNRMVSDNWRAYEHYLGVTGSEDYPQLPVLEDDQPAIDAAINASNTALVELRSFIDSLGSS